MIEVDYKKSSVDRQLIYAGLGVPELWRYEEQVMQIYQMQEGRYVPCTGSPTFANLPVREIPRFLEKSWEIGELPMMESFKTWVRQQLAELPLFQEGLETVEILCQMSYETHPTTTPVEKPQPAQSQRP